MRCSFFIILAPALIYCAGCRTARPLPPADFSAPGWRVLEGQAVWKPSASRPEMAGDLVLATNVNGNYFIQFSKIPFPLATAQVAGDQWEVDLGADKYSWHGHGAPPVRFGWLQLPRALLGKRDAVNWQFNAVGTNSWRLQNSRTGEILEGEFFP